MNQIRGDGDLFCGGSRVLGQCRAVTMLESDLAMNMDYPTLLDDLWQVLTLCGTSLVRPVVCCFL